MVWQSKIAMIKLSDAENSIQCKASFPDCLKFLKIEDNMKYLQTFQLKLKVIRQCLVETIFSWYQIKNIKMNSLKIMWEACGLPILSPQFSSMDNDFTIYVNCRHSKKPMKILYCLRSFFILCRQSETPQHFIWSRKLLETT